MRTAIISGRAVDFYLFPSICFSIYFQVQLQTNSNLVLNPSVSVSALMTLIDFTLSNARRFYSSMGNPSDTEGLSRFYMFLAL